MTTAHTPIENWVRTMGLWSCMIVLPSMVRRNSLRQSLADLDPGILYDLAPVHGLRLDERAELSG